VERQLVANPALSTRTCEVSIFCYRQAASNGFVAVQRLSENAKLLPKIEDISVGSLQWLDRNNVLLE
jgi:hypothetical protein